MKLFVNVKTKAKEQKLEKVSKYKIKAWLKSNPEKGKANNELIDLLARHYQVTRSQVLIKAGHTSAAKIIEIV